MSMNARRQYTIRNVPKSVDQALRKKARISHKSLNSVVLELLCKEAGGEAEIRIHDDLDFLIGSWVEDPDIEAALQDQRKVNMKDWK